MDTSRGGNPLANREEETPETRVSGTSIRSIAVTVIAVASIAVAGCTGAGADADTTDGDTVVATPTFGALGVPVGVALVDYREQSADRWCASFDEGEVAVGDTVTLVWPTPAPTPPLSGSRKCV